MWSDPLEPATKLGLVGATAIWLRNLERLQGLVQFSLTWRQLRVLCCTGLLIGWFKDVGYYVIIISLYYKSSRFGVWVYEHI